MRKRWIEDHEDPGEATEVDPAVASSLQAKCTENDQQVSTTIYVAVIPQS
jgi:hypothetical protein